MRSKHAKYKQIKYIQGAGCYDAMMCIFMNMAWFTWDLQMTALKVSLAVCHMQKKTTHTKWFMLHYRSFSAFMPLKEASRSVTSISSVICRCCLRQNLHCYDRHQFVPCTFTCSNSDSPCNIISFKKFFFSFSFTLFHNSWCLHKQPGFLLDWWLLYEFGLKEIHEQALFVK